MISGLIDIVKRLVLFNERLMVVSKRLDSQEDFVKDVDRRLIRIEEKLRIYEANGTLNIKMIDHESIEGTDDRFLDKDSKKDHQ